MINLYEAKINGAYEVCAIPQVALLENLGLRVGTHVMVQSRYAMGGPVLLRVEDAFTVAIGKDIATQVAVKGVPA